MKVRRLDANHDMTFGYGLQNIARDAEAVAQRVKTRLYLLQGEWFLDTDAGVPYLQKITARPADLSYTEARIKQEILATEDVDSLTDWSMTLNRETRRLDISCTVTTIYGTTQNIKVNL